MFFFLCFMLQGVFAAFMSTNQFDRKQILSPLPPLILVEYYDFSTTSSIYTFLSLIITEKTPDLETFPYFDPGV